MRFADDQVQAIRWLATDQICVQVFGSRFDGAARRQQLDTQGDEGGGDAQLAGC